MAGSFLVKLNQLGFNEFSQTLPKVQVPQSPDAIEWALAFPKIRQVVEWLTDNLDSDCVLTAEEAELLERHEVISDDEFDPSLLEYENPEDSTCPVDSLVEALKTQQESASEIDWVEEPDSFPELQSELNLALEELLASVETYLQRLNRDKDLLPLEAVQAYISADQEFSGRLWNMFQDNLSSTSVQSSTHHCLMSDLGPDFAALCMEKQHLLSRQAHGLKQSVLAKVAKAKIEARIKQLDQSLQSVGKDRMLTSAEVLLATTQLKEQEAQNQLKTPIESLTELTNSICDLQGKLFTLENELELRDDTSEMLSCLSQTILNELIEQKKRHLAVFSLILLEQQEVQSEYDELHRLEVELEELAVQADFRVQQYHDSKLKAELNSDRRKTIDQRDVELASVWQAAGGLNQEMMPVVKLKDLVKLRVKEFREAKAKRTASISKWLAEAQTFQDCLRSTMKSLDPIFTIAKQSKAELKAGVSRAQQTLETLRSDWTQMQSEVVVSSSGLSERELFVEFLTSKEPRYLQDCFDL
mmetsp:Transcript_32547/g.56291  ORF Transcript_32547/g.56291 Transcript_32547/m.56291 type:complete len:529 (-) Transcript_32547:3951-5537(-)